MAKMMFRSGFLPIFLLLTAIAPIAVGEPTTQPDPPDALLPAVSAHGPLVLHLPGIGGPRLCDHRMLAGLRDGGVKANFVICDWTDNDPGIAALQGYARNRLQAQRIADLILAHIAADPDSPIYLTAHSGGCGLAVWALEKLPSNVKVRTVLLIAPALSPGYDLTRSLHHVDGRMYAFSSTLDTVVLETGTRLFGTIDGVQTAAAGFGGFVEPLAADPLMYQKLIQRKYQSDWAKYNDFGNHIGAMSRPFAKAILAPLICPIPASATQADVTPGSPRL
jgi:pimeloyl-ACP methyl ester carboxylesterase